MTKKKKKSLLETKTGKTKSGPAGVNEAYLSLLCNMKQAPLTGTTQAVLC